MYTIISSINNSFLILVSSISLSCLVAWARTSNTMLNRSVDIGHCCLIPSLVGKVVFLFVCLFVVVFKQSPDDC